MSEGEERKGKKKKKDQEEKEEKEKKKNEESERELPVLFIAVSLFCQTSFGLVNEEVDIL